MVISLLAYVATFSRQLYPGRSYFFRVTTLSQQLLFWSRYFVSASLFCWEASFSEQSLFRGSYFFRINTFLRAKPLPSSHFLRIGSFTGSSLEQFLSGIATFLVEDLSRNRIKNIYKSAAFSKQVLLRRINFFRRATFWEKASFSEKQYFALPPFSGMLPLYSSYFFKNVTFWSSYLFRRATSSQHFFRRVITSQLRGFSRATLPFIS